jgi:heme oxygenase
MPLGPAATPPEDRTNPGGQAIAALSSGLLHIYAHNDDTAMGLAQRLREATREAHRNAERAGIMPALLRGELGREPYVRILRNLHALYAALEPALARNAADPRIAPLHRPALDRRPALERDLTALHGAGWRDIAIEPAAQRYVERLETLGNQAPHLLAAHAYVRYMGDLNGGQLLSRIVRQALQLRDDEGTAFYDFSQAGEPTQLIAGYRSALDALPLDEAQMEAVIAEAVQAFASHVEIFEELARERAG